MDFPYDFLPQPCAEFPNDNAALHEGVVWMCLTPGGPLRAIRRATLPESSTAPAQIPVASPSPSPVVSAAPSVPLPEVSVAPEPPSPKSRKAPIVAPPRPARRPELTLRSDARFEPTPIPARVLPAPVGPKDDTHAAALDLEEAPLEPTPIPPSVLPAALGPKDDILAPVLALSPRPPKVAPVVATDRDAARTGPGSRSSSGALTAGEPDAYDALVAAMVSVALASGSTRVAALLPRFLSEARTDASGLDARVVELLGKARVAEVSGSVLVATENVRVTMGAWRDVLRGMSPDMSACGETTLDGWASEVLAAFCLPLSLSEIRRELRKKGVAAFGMRIAA